MTFKVLSDSSFERVSYSGVEDLVGLVGHEVYVAFLLHGFGVRCPVKPGMTMFGCRT